MPADTLVDAHLTIMVADIARSVAFYRDRLGLRLVENAPPMWALLEAPGLRLGLHRHREGEPVPAPTSAASIGLGVEALAETVALLTARGVAFDGPMRTGERPMAFLADPDGYPVYLFEVRHGEPPRPKEPPGAWADEGGR